MNIMMLLEMASATFPDRVAFVDGTEGNSYRANSQQATPALPVGNVGNATPSPERGPSVGEDPTLALVASAPNPAALAPPGGVARGQPRMATHILEPRSLALRWASLWGTDGPRHALEWG